MNKKGFTLVELLAIVVLLGVIATVAVPNITKQISKSEKQQENVLNKKIENASKLYAAKYYADRLINQPCNDNSCTIEFTLSDLQEDKLLELSDDECKGKENDKISVSDGKNYDYSKIKGNNCFAEKNQ